jgi:hypothetical protein
MRYFKYIWAVIAFDTPWTNGKIGLQMLFWAVGLIAPALFAVGLFFNFNRTVIVLTNFFTIFSAGLLVWWLASLDYWMSSGPPVACDRDACDNDGEIRTMFAAGAALVPIILPTLIVGPIALFAALRRVSSTHRSAQLKVS